MGASCYSSKNHAQKRFSRIESCTNGWIQNGFFDLHQLLKECIEIKLSLYLSNQHHLQNLWNDITTEFAQQGENLKSQTLKKLVRRGVPDGHIKDFYYALFDYSKCEFSNHIKYVFPIEIPNEFVQVPTFSEHIKLADVVLKIYLNPEGISALSRIMWTLSSQHYSSLCYSPQIINVGSLLLIYMNEEETYETLSTMINISQKKKELISKYFTSSQEELGIMTGMITKVISHKCEELIECIERKNVKFSDCVMKILQSFGVGYFPFTFLSRLLSIFAIEGNKALIKVIISVFIAYSETIIGSDCQDFDAELRTLFFSISYSDVIFTKAFKIRLTKYSFDDIVPKITTKMAIKLYRPYLEKKFHVLKEHIIERVWAELPGLYRPYAPKCIYSSSQHGTSLRTLYRITEEYQEKTPMIFIVLSQDKEIYGIYIDQALQKHKDYIGGTDSFMFQGDPVFEIFRCVGNDTMIALVKDKMICFGGGSHGPALCVNEDLSVGQSYPSQTFANKPFGSGYFEIVSCELFVLSS